jgi:hypothetical protein
MKKLLRQSFISLVLLMISLALFQQRTFSDDKARLINLKESFISPPDSVRPGVYWTFMDGNLSHEAITADLESMKEAGIGQVLMMEVNVGLPRGKVDFLSEDSNRTSITVKTDCRFRIGQARPGLWDPLNGTTKSLKGKPRTSGRYSFTSYDYYKKDAPLLKSGLTGSVKIMKANIIE